jgi:ABC-type multidrug transport system ATPase subunit
MKVELRNVAKKYQRDWIFKNINLDLNEGEQYAVTGPNGSGKSTFIQLIASNLLPTKGQIIYTKDSNHVHPEDVYRHIAFAAPYMELPEEFTLNEFLEFHFNFKSLMPGIKARAMGEFLQLKGAENKQIKNFSTGMKQRLKLGIAALADTPILLLDEPATNLDEKGMFWYRELVSTYSKDRILVVCSNRKEEFDFCSKQINIEQYKT